MDSEMRDLLTAVLEGQHFLGARIEALSADTKARIETLSADTKARIETLSADTTARIEALSADTRARFDALSTKMGAHAADTNAKLDLLTVDMAAVKAQLVDVNERLRYLTHKTAELEQDMFVVKQKPRA